MIPSVLIVNQRISAMVSAHTGAHLYNELEELREINLLVKSLIASAAG
jgi:hypothetical protein